MKYSPMNQSFSSAQHLAPAILTPILAVGLALLSLSLSGCEPHEARAHSEHQNKVVITNPEVKDVVITQQYVCQIHAQQHINVKAMDSGYLEEIGIKEGQTVSKGHLMFRILPVLYKAKRDAEVAEAKLAELELSFSKGLSREKVVSANEVQLYEAKLAKARAKMELAEAELGFTEVRAPFDGIVDKQYEQLGSLIKEGDTLTTLSDNRVMWVYFNVPEARYIEYMATSNEEKERQLVELVLANGRKFPYPGKIGAIEGKFNNETGNIPFRADIPNPDGLLRHGMTGSILLSKTLHKAIVIPQRATFEVLDKRYVYVVGSDDVVHQREITIEHELADIFVVKKGLEAGDRIVFEGTRQVHEGQHLENSEYLPPHEILENQKFHAE